MDYKQEIGAVKLAGFFMVLAIGIIGVVGTLSF